MGEPRRRGEVAGCGDRAGSRAPPGTPAPAGHTGPCEPTLQEAAIGKKRISSTWPEHRMVPSPACAARIPGSPPFSSPPPAPRVASEPLRPGCWSQPMRARTGPPRTVGCTGAEPRSGETIVRPSDLAAKADVPDSGRRGGPVPISGSPAVQATVRLEGGQALPAARSTSRSLGTITVSS